MLDRGDEAIADGEAIDLVRPLAGQLHVDDGDDPFAVAEVLERADNQCVARDLQEERNNGVSAPMRAAQPRRSRLGPDDVVSEGVGAPASSSLLRRGTRSSAIKRRNSTTQSGTKPATERASAPRPATTSPTTDAE